MKKSFYMSNLAYYAKVLNKEDRFETMIGVYSEEDGLDGEFAIRWHELGAEDVPRIEAFNDSWASLCAVPELLEFFKEHDGKNITQEYLAKNLIRMGFEDVTVYDDPDRPDLGRELLKNQRALLELEIKKIDQKLKEKV